MAFLREEMQCFEKLIVSCDVIKTSDDTHPGIMINRTKFDACMSISFGRV